MQSTRGHPPSLIIPEEYPVVSLASDDKKMFQAFCYSYFQPKAAYHYLCDVLLLQVYKVFKLYVK